MSDYDPSDRRPQRPNSTPRERMSADYDDDRPRRSAAARGGSPDREPRGPLDIDLWTRRLVYAAAGIGAVLLAAVGGWTLLSGHHGGIPVLGPPPGPVRVKPVDPGGMQLTAGDGSTPDMTGHGEAHLAPGPEQPDPTALARHYGATPGTSDEPNPAQTPDQKPDQTPPVPAKPAADTAPDVAPQAAPASHPAEVSPAPKPVPLPSPHPNVHPTHVTPAPSEKPAMAPPASAPAPTGSHMVQLAALDSADQAHAEWARLQHRAPDLLSGRSPIVQPVERAGHTLYRLRVSGFADIAATHAFCAKLRAEQVACTPAVF